MKTTATESEDGHSRHGAGPSVWQHARNAIGWKGAGKAASPRGVRKNSDIVVIKFQEHSSFDADLAALEAGDRDAFRMARRLYLYCGEYEATGQLVQGRVRMNEVAEAIRRFDKAGDIFLDSALVIEPGEYMATTAPLPGVRSLELINCARPDGHPVGSTLR